MFERGADAQEDYTERLVQLRGTTAWQPRPHLPPAAGREEFGLPARGTIYFCPQRLAKFHPDFDFLLRRILEEDASGQLVVLAGKRPPRSLRHRTLRMEPLERRELLAVATVTAIDANAAEQDHDPGKLQISLSDTECYAQYTVSFSLSGTANVDDYLVDGACHYCTHFTVYFGTGETSKTVTITPVNDARDEPDETVILTLTDISGGGCCCCGGSSNTIGSPSSATVTIEDDDNWTISLDASEEDLIESEENTGTFTIARSGGTDMRYPISVDFAMSGAAQRGVDYQLKRADGTVLSGDSIDVPADETEVTVTIDPLNDTLVELDEDAVMSLQSASSNGVWDDLGGGCYCCSCGTWAAGGPFDIDSQADQATITIEDDDGWKVAVNRGAPPGQDADGTERLPNVEQDPGYFELRRYDDPGDDASASDTSYAIQVAFDISGTAEEGADYSLSDVAATGENGEIEPLGQLTWLDWRPDPENPEGIIETWRATIPADPASWTTSGWAFHAVAWRGSDSDSGAVYDACLRFDADPDPSVIDDYVPLNMPYTTYASTLTSGPIVRDGFGAETEVLR